MMDRQTDARRTENNVVSACLYHNGKSCSKFGEIPPSGLGDGMMDRWTDARRTEK